MFGDEKTFAGLESGDASVAHHALGCGAVIAGEAVGSPSPSKGKEAEHKCKEHQERELVSCVEQTASLDMQFDEICFRIRD